MSAAVVDRYALVSSADTLDRAWISLGWSPALDGRRASALRDSVPWPSVTAGLEAPARLRGPAEDVLRPPNWDRLDFAFLPLDGRLSLSVWGAVGPRVEATREWPVLTHTLLFDRSVFDAVAGNPFALFGTPAAPAPWLRALTERRPLEAPVRLDPVEVPRGVASLQAFRRKHLREVSELGSRALAAFEGDARRLEDALARVFEALARGTGQDAPTVAVPEGDGLGSRLLVRLVWLSLPPEDRAEVYFTTQQRRTPSPVATLAVLPEREWGRLAPEGAIRPDHLAAPERGGRRLWAQAVARHVSGAPDARAPGPPYAVILRRAEARRWRILARDDMGSIGEQAAWSRRWQGAPSREDAARLLELERGRGDRAGGPRWRAVGHVLALAERSALAAQAALGEHAVATEPDAAPDRAADGAVAPARTVVARLRPLGESGATTVARAFVRTLGRGGAASRAVAGLTRCLAASGDSPATPRTELRRLLAAERHLVDDLLRDPYGPAVLFRAAVELGRAGDGSVTSLLGASLAGMDEADGAVEWLQRTLRLAEHGDARVAYHTLRLGREVRPGPFTPARFGEWVLAGAEASPPGSAGGEILTRWLVRPEVVSWVLEEGSEGVLRRWLAVTGAPVQAIAGASAAPEAARRLPRVVALAAGAGAGAAASELLRIGVHRDRGGAWADVIEAVPWTWLRTTATLTALVGHGPAAAAAVRRIAAESGAATLAEPEVAGILRLLWEERRTHGASTSIRWIERELPRHRAVPVLARLFVGPAPIEVATALRAALLRVVGGARTPVETGLRPGVLRGRAPAVADAVEGARPGSGRLIFLTS